MIKNPRFLELLVERQWLHPEEIELLSKKHADNALAVLQELLGRAPEMKSELGRLWGDSVELAFVELSRTLFQASVVRKLPEEFARENRMIPIYRMGEATTLAIVSHINVAAIEEARRLLGTPVSLVWALPQDVQDAIDIEYRSAELIEEMLGALSFDTEDVIDAEKVKEAGDQAIAQLVREIMLLALKERASDIHVEPAEKVVRVRFRIDGVLKERLRLSPALLPQLVSRLKIMAEVDIAEKRKPQDGRLILPLANRSIDFRFSSVPTIYGEKLVLRILGSARARSIPDLSELALSQEMLKKLRRVVEAPNGVFFVTGPTGSGKTTTLYSVLKHLNQPEVNIMTIEDPVEYRLEGINQIQVNPTINLDFSQALRAFLRQDPDVILIGEIRDAETAKIASQAALTGHLVLATMHTNNAIQAVTRLVEIGVEPFLVAPSIIGVLSQRLVRRLCDKCKEKYRATPELLDRYFNWDGQRDVYFHRARGCQDCNYTGYTGRIGVHELFVLTDPVRRMISRDAAVTDLLQQAYSEGFKDLRYDGLKKVLRGLTSIEELERVSLEDSAP